MQFEKWTDLDISKGRAAVMDLGPILFSGDNHALKLGVHVYNGGEPVTVTGSVAGSAIIANGQTITPFVTGKDGNAAWVEVPQAALVCQGRIEIFMRVSENDEIAVSLYATGTVKRTTTGEAVNPGTVIPDIGTAVQECVDATAAANDAAGRAETAALTAVTYAAQTGKTDADKMQARTNIGAVDAEGLPETPVEHWDTDGSLTKYGWTLTRAAGCRYQISGEGTSENVFCRIGKTLGSTNSRATADGWVNQLTFETGVQYRLSVRPTGGAITAGSGAVRVTIEGGTVLANSVLANVPLAGGSALFTWPDAAKAGKIVVYLPNTLTVNDYAFRVDLTKCALNNAIPSAPETDGTYTLRLTVTDGVPAYAWVSESAGLMSTPLMSAAPDPTDESEE